MSRRPALGRGLASLIPEAEPASEAPRAEQPDSERITRIATELLDSGRYQPRLEFDDEALDELAQSIQEKGILLPLIVRRAGDRYELIAGERRLRAARKVGLPDVPAIVRDVSDRESLELALIENIQRDDLNAIELAMAFRQLQEDFGYTQEEVSKRVGKDRSTVTNHLRLLKLPDNVRQALTEARVSMGHARALLGLEEPALQEKALLQILDRDLSVRDTEALVKRLKKAPVPARAARSRESVEITHVTERLKRAFQTQVEIRPRKGGGGEIRIEFYSPDELNRILDLIPEP